jgi:gliding motility-associated-like protein
MKKQLQKITLFSALFLSVGIEVFGQISNCDIIATDNSICLGQSSSLSINTNTCGYLPTSLQTGINGWYSFCGNTNDLSSNNNHGVANGTTLTTDFNNFSNSAYSFNGTNNTINLPNAFLSGAQVNQFTMNTRVYFNSLANSPNIWGKTKFWGEINLQVNNAGRVYLIWANSVTGNKYSEIYTTNSVISANTWYDITVVFQSGTGQIYINGVAVPTSLRWVAQGGSVLSTSAIENSCNFAQDANSSKIGVRNSGGTLVGYLNGKVDEFKLWSFALNATQIQQNYQSSIISSTWSTGATNQTSIQVQPTQTTTYSVTVSDGVGLCTDSITIVVNQPLNLLQGADTISICGTSTVLDATNPASATYSWNTGETTPSITVSSSGEYHVTVTDTAGCASSDTIYISVIDPTITAGQSAFCLGDSTTLSINNLGGNSCGNLPAGFENGLVGRWSFCGNANDESGNGNNGVVTGATLSTDRFGNANSAYHFDGNDFIKVNSVYDYPNKTINCWFNASEIFQNGNNSYQVLNIDSQTLLYGATSAQIGSGILGLNAGGEDPGYGAPIDSNQWYMLTLVRNTSNVEYYLNGVLLGSNNSGTITSTSNDNENLLIGVDRSEIVQFFKGNIDDIGIWNRALTQQEIEQLFYHGNLSTWWSDGTTNQTSIQVQPTQTTTYSVTVSDGLGSCTDSITIQVNNPQINAGPDISVCAGDSTTLTATGASTYAWNNGVVNGQVFVPIVEGYYNVTGTDTLGCSNSVSIFLDLLQPTSSSISPVNCVNYTAPDGAVYTNSGQYTAVIPNYAGCDSTISINLTINNPSAGTEIKFACDTFTWIDGVTYTENNTSATYTLQNAAGCDSVVTLNLTINKLLNLNAGTDQVVCKGENVILAASGAETYNWNNGVSDGVAFSPPLGTTTYTVSGTDGNGCTDTDEVVVTSDYCFEIPGALSPNGDNNNDSWEIKGLSNYPNAQVTVFDRWGKKVYEGSNASTPWNGKYNEKDLPTADYYYVIELGNGDKYNGVVTLKR